MVSQAGVDDDEKTLVKALTCFGELLFEQERSDDTAVFLTISLSHIDKYDVLVYDLAGIDELFSSRVIVMRERY
ncbi:TPA: hypothetical protein RFX11_001056 [Klebsiella aerogenes]|nr:hypothetical protein [Klebsiella aerogenes]